MAREILLSKKTEQGLRLDPRTKLLLIFIISIFVMGGTGGEAMGLIRLVLCAVPEFIRNLSISEKNLLDGALHKGGTDETSCVRRGLLRGHTNAAKEIRHGTLC